MKSTDLKAIFWDNDGVLVDTERLYYEANRRILLRYGVELDRATFVEYFLKRAQGAWHLLGARGFPEEEIGRLRQERDDLYASLLRTSASALDGAEETLRLLKGRYTLGIVTSSLKVHFDLIHQRTGLLRYVDFVLTSEDFSASKPDPEPYCKALAKADRRPEECLVIEDSERGLVAASRAGIECWVIPTDLTKDSDFRAAGRILRNIREVADLLLPRQ